MTDHQKLHDWLTDEEVDALWARREAEHDPNENLAKRHRHGKAWSLREPGAQELKPADRKWIGWVALGCVVFWVAVAAVWWGVRGN